MGGPVDPSLLGTFDADGRPRVKVYRGKAASCQGGHFLVRTTAAKLSKADHFAYVPYLIDSQPPGAFNTVLKVKGLYAWHQLSPEGERVVTRFAVGSMHELQPVGNPAHGYEHMYADGADGGKARVPTLMRDCSNDPHATAPYDYGVELNQIQCTLVSTRNEKYFIPTLKASSFG